MRRTTLALILLLLASNGVWFFTRTTENVGSEPAAGRPEHAVAHLAHTPAPPPGANPVATQVPQPRLVGADRSPTTDLGGLDPQFSVQQQDILRRNDERRAAEEHVWGQVERWRSEILQFHDPQRRRAGLDGLAEAIRSEDGATASAAMTVLFDLQHAEYDPDDIRDAVRSRLADRDEQIRRVAAGALLHVQPASSDVDTLLDLLEARPADTHFLWMALAISRRAEGRLADAWLSAFEAAPQDRLQLARYLSEKWVCEEVETAVVAAFQQTDPASRDRDWYKAIGVLRPTREARVRLVFDEVQRADWQSVPASTRSLFERALERRRLDPSAIRLPVAFAIDILLRQPLQSPVESFCIDVIREHGTAADVPALDACASNATVPTRARNFVARFARELESRR